MLFGTGKCYMRGKIVIEIQEETKHPKTDKPCVRAVVATTGKELFLENSTNVTKDWKEVGLHG